MFTCYSGKNTPGSCRKVSIALLFFRGPACCMSVMLTAGRLPRLGLSSSAWLSYGVYNQHEKLDGYLY